MSPRRDAPGLTEKTARVTIADPGIAAALLSGRKTQWRVSAQSALAQCRPGERLLVREACLAARNEDKRDIVTTLPRAEFVIFRDGWRRYRDGGGKPGRPPGDTEYKWIAARHMPRWAVRIVLMVTAVREERLQQITRRDIRAEGAQPVIGGLWWRWPRPLPGRYPTAWHAFVHYWNVNHPTAGERWEDNPAIVVLDVRVEPG